MANQSKALERGLSPQQEKAIAKQREWEAKAKARLKAATQEDGTFLYGGKKYKIPTFKSKQELYQWVMKF